MQRRQFALKLKSTLIFRKGSFMRGIFSVLFLILILALLACTILARRSDKPARNSVAFLEAALIPPVLGNLMIVASGSRLPALTGHYFYYLGMDLVMGALVNFTNEYCRHREGHRSDPYIAYLLLALDAVQMLLNPFFGHAFAVNAVLVDGFDYYKLVPLWGQAIHRVVDYGVFFAVILMFILLSVKTTKIARERYTVILAAMVGIGLVQTYNIFFQYAIDRSMLGYGIFGVMIYYFAILYRPLRVLDRILSDIVSDLEDAFYIFDPNGNCLWANEQGCRLAEIKNERYELQLRICEKNSGIRAVPAAKHSSSARWVKAMRPFIMNWKKKRLRTQEAA